MEPSLAAKAAHWTRELTRACPDAPASVIDEAVKTACFYTLEAACIDSFTPWESRQVLRRYADQLARRERAA